ncbi:tripartite tricarboxylate transporter substrate binding protein [Paracoccus pantotrophus]|uniref:Tripartite tricarboxylate transporter substrate binding protein n=2 Tax=Paracoccus pantotrophus TaxID=82367 RepID=A0A7H9BTG2_PARPN|nr:tripartite tricarboxylate transporter substrate binding protein [Paracoccus pantotrophus]
MDKNGLARRSVLSGGLAMGALAALGGPALAQSDQIRWIVGYPPGGATDAIARLLAGPVSNKLGKTIIIDNRPGAGSAIGATALAQSAGDGRTVGSADDGTLIINPVAYGNLQYDPQRDFRPVSIYAQINLLLAVGKNQPFNTAQEFLEHARTAADPVPYASPSIGTPLHLAMERLARAADVKLEHIPYRGMAPALNDVLAGVVPSIVIDYTTAREMVATGELKALATFSAARLPAVPDVPTFDEVGVTGFAAGAWQSMIVPASTPDDIVAQLSEAIAFALEDETVKTRYADLGIGMPEATGPEAFWTRWQQDKDIVQPLIRDLGIQLDG